MLHDISLKNVRWHICSAKIIDAILYTLNKTFIDKLESLSF